MLYSLYFFARRSVRREYEARAASTRIRTEGTGRAYLKIRSAASSYQECIARERDCLLVANVRDATCAHTQVRQNGIFVDIDVFSRAARRTKRAAKFFFFFQKKKRMYLSLLAAIRFGNRYGTINRVLVSSFIQLRAISRVRREKGKKREKEIVHRIGCIKLVRKTIERGETIEWAASDKRKPRYLVYPEECKDTVCNIIRSIITSNCN